jgi:hypothetical protein
MRFDPVMGATMAPGEAVQVRTGDVLTHAGHVEAVGSSVGTARQAGQVVHLDAGAYGKLCVAVPVLLGLLQDRLVDALGAAADSVHDTATKLRAAAADYAATDEHSAAALDRLRTRS